MVDTRTKGLRGEYAVRDMLRNATGDAWERTPSSGALEYLKGDIYIPNEKQLIVIEVKNYKEPTLNDKLMTTKSASLQKWWPKLKLQASNAKCLPLLFHKYDRSKWFVTTDIKPTKLKNYLYAGVLDCYSFVAEDWLEVEWPMFKLATSKLVLDPKQEK
jgi:Holliday junction resolvase